MGGFRQILTAAAVAVASISGTAALAVTVDYTADNLIGTADLDNSSIATEIAELESILGLSSGTLELQEKFESGTFGVDDSGDFFVDVDPDQPGWFILKFGTGSTGEDSHYFFENLYELTKLVWTGSDVNGLLDGCNLVPGDTSPIGDPCRLSHITTVIPVPAAGLLLISAFAGLGLVRRRRKSV